MVSVSNVVEFPGTGLKRLMKFIYSEKATIFFEISMVDLSYVLKGQ